MVPNQDFDALLKHFLQIQLFQTTGVDVYQLFNLETYLY